MPCISWIVTDWMRSWWAHDARSGIVDDQPATASRGHCPPGWASGAPTTSVQDLDVLPARTDRQAIGKVEAAADVQAGAIVPQGVE